MAYDQRPPKPGATNVEFPRPRTTAEIQNDWETFKREHAHKAIAEAEAVAKAINPFFGNNAPEPVGIPGGIVEGITSSANVSTSLGLGDLRFERDRAQATVDSAFGPKVDSRMPYEMREPGGISAPTFTPVAGKIADDVVIVTDNVQPLRPPLVLDRDELLDLRTFCIEMAADIHEPGVTDVITLAKTIESYLKNG